MSNFVSFGTLTTDTSTSATSCRGWATLAGYLDSGTGTLTWEFKGADGVWRIIVAGADNITPQAYTATHMLNVFFGNQVAVRATGSSGSTPVWDWQVMSNPSNRSGA